MNAAHLHLLDLVEQVGISYSVVYSWIRGDSSPRILNLIEVCDAISQQTDIRPFDLLSEAILTFDEAVYAQQRWYKRNRSEQRNRNLLQGESLSTGIRPDDERLYFIPLDRTLLIDKLQGDLTPDMTEAEADAVECVIESADGATCLDHDIFSLCTNKNCNVGE
jgi:hypothetical protein